MSIYICKFMRAISYNLEVAIKILSKVRLRNYAQIRMKGSKIDLRREREKNRKNIMKNKKLIMIIIFEITH